MTLERRRFAGTIKCREQEYPIEFDVWSKEDGRLRVEVQPMPTQVVFALQPAMGEPASISEALTLEGSSSDGTTFFSDTANIRGARMGTHENSISVAARKAKVVLPLVQPVEGPLMRLWFRGFKSFRNPIVNMSLGRVGVTGKEKNVDRDEMSGTVEVQAGPGASLDGWFEKADDFLTFMHRGLGFAHGGRLQTPRLDLITSDRWEAIYYEGDGFGHGLAPIHFLNQGPFIEALARRFDDPKPFPDMLWTAIGWLHIENPFDEARFLMSMTALEAVVEHLIPKTLTTVMPKPNFEPLREKLLQALADSEVDQIPREIFEGKIKGLNGRALSQKIKALRDHYGLSATIFTNEAIVDAIKARNDIVHTGATPGRRKIWPKVVFVRELISMIVFHEIGYAGPYESYIAGYRMIHPELEGGRG